LREQKQPEGRIDIDFSELEGRSYSCIDGCALCCLCQPELLPDEERKLRNDPRLVGAISGKHISPDVRGAAIKLRGEHGACYFLDKKRCGIYADRPHFCRSFPISVFVGWRVQLNVNLSCRGIGLAGEPLRKLGQEIMTGFDERTLYDEFSSARRVFSDFNSNMREARIAQSVQSVRDAAQTVVGNLSDAIGLSKILTYAENGNTRQNSSANDIVRLARKSEAEANLEERAVIDGTELFDLPEKSMLPVYINERLDWRIFQLVDKEIVGYNLSEDGKIEEMSRTDPSDVELLPIGEDGARLFNEYFSTVNRRDCFLGHAAHLCDLEGYEFNFAQVYLGTMATNALDLWWRSSFLASLEGRERLDLREIREGIVFFDMDLLDLPTIGAFI
jgi:Fe-S-cluster containining protein